MNIEIISSVLATVQGHFFLPVLRIFHIARIVIHFRRQCILLVWLHCNRHCKFIQLKIYEAVLVIGLELGQVGQAGDRPFWLLLFLLVLVLSYTVTDLIPFEGRQYQKATLSSNPKRDYDWPSKAFFYVYQKSYYIIFFFYGTSNYRNPQILPKSPYFYRNHPRYYRNPHQIFWNSFQKKKI